MTDIPPDLKRLLDPGQSPDPDPGPIQFLWVYDPVENEVHVDHNEDRHPTERITHKDFKTDVTHESAVRGFAYRIKGGWRITDRDSQEVKDPYIVKLVIAALKGEPAAQPGPHPRPHGMPS
jgi:hypothetical protein